MMPARVLCDYGNGRKWFEKAPRCVGGNGRRKLVVAQYGNSHANSNTDIVDVLHFVLFVVGG